VHGFRQTPIQLRKKGGKPPPFLKREEHMNYIDIKVTVWNRIHFTDDADMQKLVDLIQQIGIDSIYEDESGFSELETLYDTESSVTPEQNDGEATIEVYEKDRYIWNNAIQKHATL
jgi:hypothetical protein